MKRHRVAFVIEHTLGHITFAHMLRRAVEADPSIDPIWILIEPTSPPATVARLFPPSRNYTLTMSARARRSLGSGRGIDAIFIHTPTCALMATGLMRRVPTVLSLDATPKNIDTLAAGYQHEVLGTRVEQLKAAALSRVLRTASTVMPWSHWAERSVVQDYGVDPTRVSVVSPGVSTDDRPSEPHPTSRVRILFVGGDFDRKGGPDLLSVLSQLEHPWECDVVTKTTVAAPPGVHVHQNLHPGDQALKDLFIGADIFVLPTRSDAHPWVVMEAMAAGQPVVSTRIGAIPEIVDHGVTGLLTEPSDQDGLRMAITRLVASPDERAAMALKGRRRALAYFDAGRQGELILDLVKRAART